MKTLRFLLLLLTLPVLAQEVVQLDTVAELTAASPKLLGRLDGSGVNRAAVFVRRYSSSVAVGAGAATYVWQPSYAGTTNALGGALAVTGGAWVNVSRPLTPQMFGAVGDGSTDDSAALQAWLNSTSDTLLLPANTFLTGSRLELTRSGVHIDWYGTIKAASNINNHVFLVGGAGYSSVTNNVIYPQLSGITIDGHGQGTLNGNSTNATECFNADGTFIYSSQGIYFYGVSNAVVRGMNVLNAVTFALSFNQCESVLVQGVRVDNGNGNNSSLYNGKNADGIHWTDCKNVLASDLDVRSSDDCLSITSIRAAVSRFSISNVRLTHSMVGVGSYLTRGHCLRVSPDSIAISGATISGVTLDGFDMTGGHAAFVIGHGGPSYYTSNVRLSNGLVHDYTDDGNATYQSTTLGLVDEVSGLSVSGVTFTNCTKAISLQDNTGTKFSECSFLNFGENQYLTTWAPIIFDGDQGATINAQISGCLFDGIWQQGIRIIGNGVSDRIAIIGNSFMNGGAAVASPASTGYAAISLSQLTEGATVAQNRVVDWAGSGVSATDVPALAVTANVFDGIGNGVVTNAYGVAATAAAGTLMNQLIVNNNLFTSGAASAILENNHTTLEISGNVMVGNVAIAGTGGHIQLGIKGDGGSNPVSSSMSGTVSGNVIVGSVGNAIVTSVSTAPTYTGSPLLLLGNSISGFAQNFSLDGAYGINASVLTLPLAIESVPTTAARNYIKWSVNSSSSDAAKSALLVDRYLSGSTAISSAQYSLSAINRMQSTGNSSSVFGGSQIVTSLDTAATVSSLYGNNVLVRLTAAGTASNAYAENAQLQLTAAGVMISAAGVNVSAPSISGGGTIGTYSAIRIPPQSNSGITNVFAINQAGTSDTNLFAGPTYFTGSVLIGGNRAATQPTTETLSYSGTTVTVTGGKGPNQSSVLTCTNDFTLSFSSVADNGGGTIWVHPAATNCTVTLSSPAYGPSGTTLTINGGTGSTNHTVLAWKVTTVNSTNVIDVNALNYYR